MSIETEPSDYENIVLELYYSNQVSKDLREQLENCFEDSYREKYTRSILGPGNPFLSIKSSSEHVSLFGDEITIENINNVLEEDLETDSISDL